MLENIDLSLAVKNGEYKESMKILEVKLGELQRKAWELKIPIIFVFEGWHASGMGEDINRFILPLDPRGYDFYPMTLDCHEDALKPFLLHFWALTPLRGKIAIFDQKLVQQGNYKTFQEGKIRRKTWEMPGRNKLVRTPAFR